MVTSLLTALLLSTPVQQGALLEVQINDTPGEDLLTTWESGQPEIPGVVSSFGLGALAEQATKQSNRQQGPL